MWDDKDLQANDIVDFLESDTEKYFTTAQLTNVVEKPLGKLTEQDKKGHEPFKNDQEMYDTYKKYYKKDVDSKTLVKIVYFKLIS